MYSEPRSLLRPLLSCGIAPPGIRNLFTLMSRWTPLRISLGRKLSGLRAAVSRMSRFLAHGQEPQM